MLPHRKFPFHNNNSLSLSFDIISHVMCCVCWKKSVRYISAKDKKIHSGITRNGKKEVGFNNIGNIIFEKLRKKNLKHEFILN
jgi:hypothetical protein